MDTTGTLSAVLDEPGLRGLLAELGEEARAYRFLAAPNPCVGAAVFAGGREVARGFHRAFGGSHAEVEALAAAEESGVPRETWDLLLVTLEPCSTTGRTPPCTDAVLASGIRRIVIGSLDRDPRHRGKGIELLTEAGLEVDVLHRGAPLETVAPQFLRWIDPDRLRRPRPWTIAKWAQTLTGQLTPPKDVGEGRWISGPDSLAEVQRLRAAVDAIVTGVGTVLADDPRLTLRGDEESNGDSHPPLRVVLDSELRTPPDARLFATVGRTEEGSGGEVHVLCRAGAAPTRHRVLESAGVNIHSLRPDSEGHVSLRAVQEWLWGEGVRRVLLEAGPVLLGAALAAGFVDQLAVYTGSIPGGQGLSLADWLAPERLEQPLHR
ncbi:MAG: bifunctional diaminohydroxyphosphoribosylaminopyrimidine deaminase/5-amino-6-(5-phosphoribosylamino)uracil reductase RibD, partial [Planctomycetota bacterium]|nr:bifunctional diaminohydroxyphosphoribosylaminopyrimidine deaminase/5-amino-6-(5-phosphoribosylamino)uracil reductase RibD [Planctomycetota bacterium]